ncbi:MAG: Gfo/Idh/MocA family oxidoreductase [Anaerolineae bacterium]
MGQAQPIRLGIVGAGIFAREAHVPVLQALRDRFEIVAVCSRTTESTGRLAARLDDPVDEVHDLDALLTRPDIDAVDLVLPIPLLPEAVSRALAAGKHVISEKPIAPTLAEARRLLAQFAVRAGQVWMVAENYRYEECFVRAAEIVQSGALGQIVAGDLAIYIGLDPSNRYYQTAWRRDGSYPGGGILDGGVHHVAGMRMVLGEVAAVSAVVRQQRADLPPADTLSAALVFDSGAVVGYSVTYAAAAPWYGPLQIVGERGALRILRTGSLELTVEGSTQTITVEPLGGVRGEFLAFADAIQHGTPHRNTPEQAAQDVAVVEALLRSGAEGRQVIPERIVR